MQAHNYSKQDSKNAWSKSSWRNFPIKQHPTYSDTKELASVEKELASYPPLVFAGEARSLKAHFARVQEGKALCRKLRSV